MPILNYFLRVFNLSTSYGPFDSDKEVSYWVYTIVSYSAVAIIVHIHAICGSALNWVSFQFGVIISFPEYSHSI